MRVGRYRLEGRVTLLIALCVGSIALGCSPANPAWPTLPPSEAASATSDPTAAETGPTPTPGPVLTYDKPFLLYENRRLSNDEIDFEALLARGKPLLVNVWAGACPPCQWEMADFQATHTKYADKVTFFGIEVGTLTNLGTVEDAETLLDRAGVTYLTGHTTDLQFLIDFRITGVPSTFFISPSGAIRQKWTGLLTPERLEAMLIDLLAYSERTGADR